MVGFAEDVQAKKPKRARTSMKNVFEVLDDDDSPVPFGRYSGAVPLA